MTWPTFISFRFSEKLIKWPKLQEMRWLPGAAPPDPPEGAQRALRPHSSLLHAIGVCANARGVRLISAPPQCFAGSAAPGKGKHFKFMPAWKVWGRAQYIYKTFGWRKSLIIANEAIWHGEINVGNIGSPVSLAIYR